MNSKTLYLIKNQLDTKWEEIKVNKISLSCFDDKTFVLNDGIHTLAYFHRELKKWIFKDDLEKRESKRFSQTIKDLHN